MEVTALGVVLALAYTVESSDDCRDGFFACLKLDVGKALARISSSNKEKIVLLDGIHLDRYGFNYDPSRNAGLEADNDIPYSDDVEPPANNVLGRLITNADRVFDSHYLLVELVPGFNIKIYKTGSDKFWLSLVRSREHHSSSVAGARTFGIGARKRLQMALLPIMYKLGVITTLLVGLTVLTLKALTIGVILLILAFGGILTKMKAAPWEEGYGHHNKDIHIHVHPFVGKAPGHWKSWQRQEDVIAEQEPQQDHHPSEKPIQDQRLPPPPPLHHLLGSPSNRPYTYFPPSVSGLID